MAIPHFSATASPPDIVQTSYAGFWWRFLAHSLDALCLSLILGLVAALTMAFDGGIITAITGFLLPWFYTAGLESSRLRATLGKQICGLKVVDYQGRRIGFWHATGRQLGKILSALLFFIGFIMIAFTKRKQGLHDMLVGTLVLRQRREPPPLMPPPLR